MSVNVVAMLVPAPGQGQQLEEALSRTIPAVHAEEGCLLYAAHRADDGTVVLIERWQSEEDLEAHNAGPAVAALGEAISPFLGGAPQVLKLSALPAGDEARGVL